MCKKSEYDHTTKWYMQNPAAVLGNETHKLLWDFDTQTDHLISARRPDLIIINKKRELTKFKDFAVLADHRVKLKENEKNDKYLDLARELKNCGTRKWCLYQMLLVLFVTEGLLKRLEDLEIIGRWRQSK